MRRKASLTLSTESVAEMVPRPSNLPFSTRESWAGEQMNWEFTGEEMHCPREANPSRSFQAPARLSRMGASAWAGGALRKSVIMRAQRECAKNFIGVNTIPYSPTISKKRE